MFTIIINTKFCVYFRKEELEMRDARIAVVPLIVAEQQRMWVHCSCGWEHKYTMNSWHIWCHDGLFFLLSCTVVSKFNMLNSDTFHVCWVIAVLSLSTKLCFAQGTAQWLEHLDLWLKGCGFESLQERRENFLLHGVRCTQKTCAETAAVSRGTSHASA